MLDYVAKKIQALNLQFPNMDDLSVLCCVEFPRYGFLNFDVNVSGSGGIKADKKTFGRLSLTKKMEIWKNTAYDETLEEAEIPKSEYHQLNELEIFNNWPESIDITVQYPYNSKPTIKIFLQWLKERTIETTITTKHEEHQV